MTVAEQIAATLEEIGPTHIAELRDIVSGRYKSTPSTVYTTTSVMIKAGELMKDANKIVSLVDAEDTAEVTAIEAQIIRLVGTAGEHPPNTARLLSEIGEGVEGKALKAACVSLVERKYLTPLPGGCYALGPKARKPALKKPAPVKYDPPKLGAVTTDEAEPETEVEDDDPPIELSDEVIERIDALYRETPCRVFAFEYTTPAFEISVRGEAAYCLNVVSAALDTIEAQTIEEGDTDA